MKKIQGIFFFLFCLLGLSFAISSPANAASPPADCMFPGLDEELSFYCPSPYIWMCSDSAGSLWCCKSEDACKEKAESGGTGFQPEECAAPSGGKGIQTAIGCIPESVSGFGGFFLAYLLGFAGVIAFFLIIFAGFQIITSSGNPEKLEGAKQLLTAAFVGLLFIIFAVVILQFIGTNILGVFGRMLPGFPNFIPGSFI